MKKDLAYYRSLPYVLGVRQFTEDEDGETYYLAEYKELPQVKGVHRDPLLARKLAKELFDSYVEAQLAWGEPIPEPEHRRFRRRGGRGLFRLSVEEDTSGPGVGVKQQAQEEAQKTRASAGRAKVYA